jgi:hypothetical protein
MGTKDSVIGAAKQIVAEIVGDGRLAEEGARQSHRGDPVLPHTGRDIHAPQERSTPAPTTLLSTKMSPMDETRFATLLGHAALKVWPDLPGDAQERLFAAAIDDAGVANDLAQFLHDRHPRTAHPRSENTATETSDRDLVHGEGGTLGLGDNRDLHEDD